MDHIYTSTHQHAASILIKIVGTDQEYLWVKMKKLFIKLLFLAPIVAPYAAQVYVRLRSLGKRRAPYAEITRIMR